MTHHDEIPENDDLDIEFSDLLLDRAPTPIEKLVLRVVALLSKLWGAVHWQPARISHLLARLRGWLLAKPPVQRFADGSTSDDIELEMADLDTAPRVYDRRAIRAFSLPGVRVLFKTRLWRIAVALCTIILAFALVFSTVPQARGWIESLLARHDAGDSSSSSYSSASTQSNIRIVTINQNVSPLPGGTVVAWQPDMTPGAAPQGQGCPARQLTRLSTWLGGTPVWVSGFAGARATLHFDPQPVFAPVFPGSFGWSASLTIEVQANYTQPITISGENREDGTYIFFNYYLNQDKQSSFMFLNSPQTLVPPTLSSTGLGNMLTWKVELYFAGAGCYSLHAQWGTGSWAVNFAAGR